MKVCQPAVVQNFAAVTRKYQLAYCYTVIERNSRSNLPVLESSNRFTNWLDTFFPFDPYLLLLSGHKITSFYNDSQCILNNATDSNVSKNKSECEEDDFMDESFSSPRSLESQNHLDKFSYSTSPGFIYTWSCNIFKVFVINSISKSYIAMYRYLITWAKFSTHKSVKVTFDSLAKNVSKRL